jgi:hypothetical protein
LAPNEVADLKQLLCAAAADVNSRAGPSNHLLLLLLLPLICRCPRLQTAAAAWQRRRVLLLVQRRQRRQGVESCQQRLHLRLQLRQQRAGVSYILPVLIPQLVQLLLCGCQLLLAVCKLLLQVWRAVWPPLLLLLLLLTLPVLQLLFQRVDLDAEAARQRRTDSI